MKRHLLLLLAAIGFCALVWILVSRLHARNPVYQGKTVRTWLFQLSASDPEARGEAEAAFKALGTDAIPELARLVRTDDARWRTLVWSHATNFSKPVRRLIVTRVRQPMAHVIHPAAAQVLGTYGSNAAPAVPALIRLLRRGDPYEQAIAARSLAEIGAPALAALDDVAVHEKGAASYAVVNALLRYYPWPRSGSAASGTASGDPTASARQPTIESLRASARANEIIVKVLARAVRDPTPSVRLAALKTLAQGNRDLQPILPQLIACSYDGSSAIREWSARTLGRIAPPATPAIPALTRLAEDPDQSVRAAAEAALETIQAGGQTRSPAPPR